MIENEKQLLLKDLSARLPYGVKMQYKDEPGYEILCQIDTFYKDVDGFRCLLRTTSPFGGFQDLNELKPYLRPISSMTEKENEELKYVIELELQALEGDEGHNTVSATPAAFEIDFYNKHHLDYRGLIEKGLALEAPEGMYKTE